MPSASRLAPCATTSRRGCSPRPAGSVQTPATGASISIGSSSSVASRTKACRWPRFAPALTRDRRHRRCWPMPAGHRLSHGSRCSERRISPPWQELFHPGIVPRGSESDSSPGSSFTSGVTRHRRAKLSAWWRPRTRSSEQESRVAERAHADGTCAICHGPIRRGEPVRGTGSHAKAGFAHATCVATTIHTGAYGCQCGHGRAEHPVTEGGRCTACSCIWFHSATP